MTARDYFRSVLQLLTTSAVVTGQQITFDEQDVYVAYLKGSISLTDGSTLFFAQYVRIEGAGNDQIDRKKYRYHWQDPDDAGHYPNGSGFSHPGPATFPDHIHVGPNEEAQQSGPADLWQVIGQIEKEI